MYSFVKLQFFFHLLLKVHHVTGLYGDISVCCVLHNLVCGCDTLKSLFESSLFHSRNVSYVATNDGFRLA